MSTMFLYLVLVKMAKNEEPLIGVISDKNGKYSIPEYKLEKNKSSAEAAEKLVHTFVNVDSSQEYNVE